MSLLKHAPQFTLEQAAILARDLYGLDAEARSLPSERDQNFLLTTDHGRFVLKIANSLESRTLLEAQNQAMQHLASKVSLCPRVLNAQSGEAIVQILTQTAPHYVRLVTFIDGQPLAKVPQTSSLFFDLGASLGKVTRALSNFDHEALHRDFHWDLANGLRVVSDYDALLNDASSRELVTRFAVQFQTEVGPRLDSLPRSVIHGDANDYNVIVDRERIVGLIDFGDMVYSYTACELAVALAYVVLDKPDPLAVTREVVAGYLTEMSLSQEELELLWPLVLMRCCMSVCMAAFQQQQNPENKYLDISQRSIRNSLPKLLAIRSDVVANMMKSKS
jgi:Ser/Thr protein kinase RdoA (MazF antagonist)